MIEWHPSGESRVTSDGTVPQLLSGKTSDKVISYLDLEVLGSNPRRPLAA